MDTDIGGDVDDLCALAMVLGWPDAEITGITTVAEHSGRRPGYAKHALDLAGSPPVPIAAGVDVSSGRYTDPMLVPDEATYWGGAVRSLPGPISAALDLLRHSIDLGAVIVALGPYSNLDELERSYPGTLPRAQLVLMGGHAFPPPAGFPPWGAAEDFNIQADVAAAETVLREGNPVLVPLNLTVQTVVERSQLPRLQQGGPFGALLARQIEAQARAEQTQEKWGRPYPALPDDMLAFLHDPLGCAVALGWDGVRLETLPIAWERDQELLRMRVEQAGRPATLTMSVDGQTFRSKWLETVARL